MSKVSRAEWFRNQRWATGCPLTRVGHPSLCRELCQQDPKGPHIRLDGEPAIEGGFWSRPLDGKFGTCRSKKGQGMLNRMS